MRDDDEARRGGNLERAPDDVCSAADTRNDNLNESERQPLGATAPQPNTAEAIDFLTRYRGSEPIVLTAIHPETRAVTSETFCPSKDVARLRSWIDPRQGVENIYFHVNPTTRPLSGRVKAQKAQIRGMTTLHVDLDPRPN